MDHNNTRDRYVEVIALHKDGVWSEQQEIQLVSVSYVQAYYMLNGLKAQVGFGKRRKTALNIWWIMYEHAEGHNDPAIVHSNQVFLKEFCQPSINVPKPVRGMRCPFWWVLLYEDENTHSFLLSSFVRSALAAAQPWNLLQSTDQLLQKSLFPMRLTC